MYILTFVYKTHLTTYLFIKFCFGYDRCIRRAQIEAARKAAAEELAARRAAEAKARAEAEAERKAAVEAAPLGEGSGLPVPNKNATNNTNEKENRHGN